MSRIEIVHVITGLRTAGAETMLAKLVEVMDRTKFNQTVVSLLDQGALGRRIEQAGAAVIALNMRGAGDLPRAILKLRSVLRERSPDVVQTWLYHADFIGTLASRLAGPTPVAWNVRCSNMNFADYGLTTRLICAFLARMSSMPKLVISNSHTGRQVHEELGYRAREWQLIPNGFDVDYFRPDGERAAAFRASLGVGFETPLIGLPGRLDPMKDHDNFLEAASIFAQKNAAARFVLVGKGLEPSNEEFVSRIRKKGLFDRVYLLGERGDMNVVMAGLNIVTLCSAYGEGFPNVLGEALSCGALCVATDVGDSARVLGGHGLIIRPKQPADLAHAWRTLLSLTPDERLTQASAGRQHVVENYSLHAVGRTYEEVYRRLAHAR